MINFIFKLTVILFVVSAHLGGPASAGHDSSETEIDNANFNINKFMEDLVADDQFSREEIELELGQHFHDHDHNHQHGEPNNSHQLNSTCPFGYFTCANGECISPKWRCDGHYDCDDFSDELNCTNVDISGIAPIDHKLITPAPLPPPPKEDYADIQFQSESEPLMLFSTGTSIRGQWMKSRIYFDVVTIGEVEPAEMNPISITQVFSLLFGRLGAGDPGVPKEEKSVKSRNTIVGVDMDPFTKEVYWVELGRDAGVFSTQVDNEQFELRQRRRYDKPSGPRHKTVVFSGLLSPEDIAIDTLGHNLYITDAGLPAIIVCSVKESHCKIIASEGIHKPRAIILDSSTGWLTFTDWGDHPGIYLVSMDGRRRESLVTEGIVWPNGLAMDQVGNQLYWADARMSKIERIDLTTRKRQEVVREHAPNPFSLAMFENRIYWSDWSGSDIRTCDKNSGNSTKVLMHAEHIYGIHIYHPSLYPRSSNDANPCWSKKCSHMCLLSPSRGHEKFADRKPGSISGNCACPETMALSVGDKATCYDVQLSFLLVNVKNYIAQVFPERIGLRTLEMLVYSEEHYIHDVASDWLHYRLFFYDANQELIYLVDMNKGIKIRSFLHVSSSVRGLLYDSSSDNLYWLDSDRGTLTLGSVKGKFEKVIRKDLERPISLVLDSKNRVFYIAMLGSSPKIIRTDITASQETDVKIVVSDIGLPVALHLDESAQRLYWADARHETIESIDLSVTTPSGVKANTRLVHKRKLGTILAFTVYRDHFLWTIKNGDYLYRASKTNSSDFSKSLTSNDEQRPVSFQLPPNPSKEISTDNKRIIVVDPKLEIVSSPCEKKGCSHGCILDRNHQAVCFCPENERLSPTNKTNCIEAKDFHCEPNFFKCHDNSHCIQQQWRCDGQQDCDDNSDEMNCNRKMECPEGDFRCKNGHCISMSWKCDQTDDCADNSDEENCPKRPDSSCTVGYFSCGDGRCIPQLWRCDREPDCSNGSDENDCRTEKCKPNFFRCHDNSCIPHNWVCDKFNDCPDGEDEANCAESKCTNGQFSCDAHLCLDNRFKCDGHKDCMDGTDELQCEKKKTCPAHMITCPSDGHCIYQVDMCDQHSDCEDSFDEKNCTSWQLCQNYETTCGESLNWDDAKKVKIIGLNANTTRHTKCIPRAWLCDGDNDCGDWSDELHNKCHIHTEESATTSKPCHDGSYPCGSGECIDWNKVCDREQHCLDGTDEGGLCAVSCTIVNGGCAQQCRSSPLGPSCSCHKGYRMTNDTKSCEDINECEEPGNCSQFCYNFKGGYKCTCSRGYALASDNRHCKAIGIDDPFLIQMLPNKIKKLELIKREEAIIWASDDSVISGVDYDYDSGLVYWAEKDHGDIRSFSFRNQHQLEPVIEFSGLNQPSHLAYDWIGHNLYFSQIKGTMNMCNIDNKHCATLFNGRIINCNSIAAAPTVGYLFWAVSSDESAPSGFVSGLIERAELDGSHRLVIVHDKVHTPMAIAIDHVLNRLYWTDMKQDEIVSVDFSGHHRITVLSYALQHPAGLAIFEDQLYVSNIGSDNILRVNKFTQTRSAAYEADAKSDFLHIPHRVNQPKPELDSMNPCFNTTCSHICAPTNSTRYGCVCANGFILGSDLHTCRPFDPRDCQGDSTRCHNGVCKANGIVWRCDCPADTYEPFCDLSPPQADALINETTSRAGDDSGVLWFIVVMILIAIVGLITLISLMVLHRQGRLPRQVSNLSVSFIKANHDKDGSMLLLDDES